MSKGPSLPTVVFEYGCRPEPDSRKPLQDQIYESSRFRNKLVELERSRRDGFHRAMCEISPEYKQKADLYKSLEGLSREEISELEKENPGVKKSWQEAKTIRDAALAAHREKADGILLASPEWLEAMDAFNATTTTGKSKVRREVLFPLRARLYGEAGFVDPVADNEEQHYVAEKAAAAESPITGSSKTQILRESRGLRTGKPPAFKRFDGDKISIQFKGGIAWSELVAGKSRQMQIEQIATPDRTGRRAGRKHRIRFRLGGSRGSASVLAEVHRPIPEDARIMWAHIVGKKVAYKIHWSIQFAVARKDGWDKEDRAGGGVCGVFVRAYKANAEKLVVATWAADRPLTRPGTAELQALHCDVLNDGTAGRVTMPEELCDRLSYVDTLRRLRDKSYDELKLHIGNWVRENKESVPEWFRERVSHSHKWRSAGRVALLLKDWAESRFEGDAKLFEKCEAWLKHDRHLWTWQEEQRKRTIRQRREIYRLVAAVLRRHYRHVFRDKRELKRMNKPKDKREVSGDLRKIEAAAHHVATVASPGAFVECFAGILELVPREGIVETCHRCQKPHGGSDASPNFRCESCSVMLDRSLNASQNILASGQVMLKTGKSLAVQSGKGVRNETKVAESGSIGSAGGGSRKNDRGTMASRDL